MSLADQSQQWFPTTAQVTVLQARGLRAKGKNGTNDAYAIMQVAKDKFSTAVAEKSVAPMWKEQASFDLPPAHQGTAERGTLRVHVMHRALVGPDKLLGLAAVNLLELHEVESRNKTEWFKLLDKAGKADKERGEVLLDIQFTRNNMTASMFDLSGADGSRSSRIGKFKDKLRGKKKGDAAAAAAAAPDSASAVVPASFSQVLTDSEGEGEGGEEAAGEKGGKKKLKLKSLFSHKSNLRKGSSQSLSFLGGLPEGNRALFGSRSSGLNVEPASEGKKKFKFGIHKRSGSTDSRASQASGVVPAAAEAQRGAPGPGYTEEAPGRGGSRASSTFSLSSSGRGSMEDLHRGPGGSMEGSFSSYDSLRVPRPQASSWMGSKATEEEVEEEVEEEEEDSSEYERRRRDEEEERARQEEQMRIDRRRAEEEQEQRKRQDAERTRREETERWEAEERRQKAQRDEENRIRMEREEEEEETFRREEERARMEEERKEAEWKRQVEEERERMRVMEEERKKQEEEERFRMREEMERTAKERAEKERWEEQARMEREEEEERKKREWEEQQERIRMEKEQERRAEEDERVRVRREEEERRVREEEEREEEAKRVREERRLREEEEREEEAKRVREERRLREEEEREEEAKRVREEKRLREEEEREKEAKRVREERRLREEEEREEEAKRVREEKRLREEEEREKEVKRVREERRLREEEEEEKRGREEIRMMEEIRLRKEEKEEEEKRVREGIRMVEESRLGEKEREEEEGKRMRGEIWMWEEEREERRLREEEEEEREEERRVKEEEERMSQMKERAERRLRESELEDERVRKEREEEERREKEETARVEKERKHQEEERIRMEAEQRRREEEEEEKEEAIKRHEQLRQVEEERRRATEQQRSQSERGESEEEEDELEEEFVALGQTRSTLFDIPPAPDSYFGPGAAPNGDGPRAPAGGVASARRRGPAPPPPPSGDHAPHAPARPFVDQTVSVPTARPSPASPRSPPLLLEPSNPFFEASEPEPDPDDQLSGKKRRAPPPPPSPRDLPPDKPPRDRTGGEVSAAPPAPPPGGRRLLAAPRAPERHGAQIERPASQDPTPPAKTTRDAPRPSERTKGPAPSKPSPGRTEVSARLRGGGPERARRTAPSFEDAGKKKEQRPSTNPFDEDEDQEEEEEEEEGPPAAPAATVTPKCPSGAEAQTPDGADGSSSSKGRSLKTARAPPPPEVKGQSAPAKGGAARPDPPDSVPSSVALAGPRAASEPGEEQAVAARACVSKGGRVETNARTALVGSETGTGPPPPSRRAHPVKPLTPSEQQSPVSARTATLPSEVLRAGGDSVEDDEASGPFAQLTRGELLLLLQKLQGQLTQRDCKISELEQYIDNLLVRIMEEEPSILMSLSATKH